MLRRNRMAWIFLIIAGVLEIFWAMSLRYTDGFTNLSWGIVTILSGLASFYFLAQAIRTIPIGTGYAVWTGIGAAGTAVIGMISYAVFCLKKKKRRIQAPFC